MNIFIKNADTISHTYSGQEIAPNTYYQLQPVDEARFANNADLISDIGSGLAVVAKTNDGTTDFNDIVLAIKYLQKNNPIQASIVLGTDIYTTRPYATTFTAIKNTTTTHDIPITETVQAKGGEVGVWNFTPGDYLSAVIIDVNGILEGIAYPEGTPLPVVLKDYIPKWYVLPDGICRFVDDSLSDPISPGLFVRISYTSTANIQDATVVMNVIAYKVAT